jgi:hypothetical protein
VSSTNEQQKGKQKMKLLSRRDEGLGVGLFDSIKWALDVHVQQPDCGTYKFAVLYGNEDSPDRIDFWATEPVVGVAPRFIWMPRPQALLMNSLQARP